MTLWILGSLAVVLSVSQGWKDETGVPVSVRQFWADGFGLLIVGFGLVMILLATIIYKGWPWVRHALMLGLVGLSGFLMSEYKNVPAVLLIVASITIALGVRYLYFHYEVIDYFNQKQNEGQSRTQTE